MSLPSPLPLENIWGQRKHHVWDGRLNQMRCLEKSISVFQNMFPFLLVHFKEKTLVELQGRWSGFTFFSFPNRGEDLKNETNPSKLFLLMSVSNGSGFLISSANVLMSVFGLPVQLAYLNMLLLQTCMVDALLQLWCIYVKTSLKTVAAEFSLSAFYSIAKLWLKHNSRKWISWLWCSGECEPSHNPPFLQAFTGIDGIMWNMPWLGKGDFNAFQKGKKVSAAFQWLFSWRISGVNLTSVCFLVSPFWPHQLVTVVTCDAEQHNYEGAALKTVTVLAEWWWLTPTRWRHSVFQTSSCELIFKKWIGVLPLMQTTAVFDLKLITLSSSSYK